MLWEKHLCKGCILSFLQSGNKEKCPFCKTEIKGKTAEEHVEDIRKQVEANDDASISLLANSYHHGLHGIQQDHAKAIKLFTKSAELGFIEAHYQLGSIYENGGDLKKAKLHYENAAMAGHEHARFHLGGFEAQAGNVERAIKHWIIAASAGHFTAMHDLRTLFEKGYVSRELIDSTLTAYNNSCAKMRSEARDAYMRHFY
jgi:TPR repeat protein